jgi:hypothetical protein
MMIRDFIIRLLGLKESDLSPQKLSLLDDFAQQEATQSLFDQIKQAQQNIMNNWRLQSRIQDIQNLSIKIPNAKVGVPFHAVISRSDYDLNDVATLQLEGITTVGLTYDPETGTLSGVPREAGNFVLKLCFRLNDEPPGQPLHEKKIDFIVNPDPKSLWKSIPSNPEAPFWKPDTASDTAPLGDRHIVVASKRGRSHANVGSFRDDDYSFGDIGQTGWALAAVADGAGSATLSRRGSFVATESLKQYFQNVPADTWQALDDAVQAALVAAPSPELEPIAVELLETAVKHVFISLETEAKLNNNNLSDYHTTLSFVLFKSTGAGYVILSFGVGDCPIGVIDAQFNVTLLNKLDVGEYGGGTRFVTMPDIFQSGSWRGRFRVHQTTEMEYLMLMTDGIYDPKFEVEANLEKNSVWKIFIDDLNGENNTGDKVYFDPGNAQAGEQLLAWMDFWSQGNHDDRTLAVIF